MAVISVGTGDPPSWVRPRVAAWNRLTAGWTSGSAVENVSAASARVVNYSVATGDSAVAIFQRIRNADGLALSGGPGTSDRGVPQLTPISSGVDALIDNMTGANPGAGDIGPPPSHWSDLLLPPDMRNQPQPSGPNPTEPKPGEQQPAPVQPPVQPQPPSGGSPGSNPVLPPVPSSAEPQRPVPSVQDVPVGFPTSPDGSPVGSGVFKTLYVDPPPPEQKPFPLVSIEDTTAMADRMPEAAGERMELPSGTVLEVTADAKSIIVTIPGQAPYLIASPNYYETVPGDSLTLSDPTVPGLVPASPEPPRMLHGIDPDGNRVEIYIPTRPENVSPLNDSEPAKYVRVNYSDGTSGLAALNWRGEYLYPVDKYHRQKEASAPDPFMEKSFWENTVSFGAGLVSPVWDSVKDAGAKAGIGGPGVENAWMDSLTGMGSLVGLGREGGPGVLDTWKALGKDLIAWDEWARGDWSYATGIVLSNLITTVGTDGTGLALKINKITSRLPDVDVPVSKTDGTGPSTEKPNTTQPGRNTEQPKAEEPAPQPKPEAAAPKNEPTHATGDADQTPEPTRPDPVQDQPPGPPGGPPDFPAGGIEFPGPKVPSNGIGEIPQKLAAPNGITGRTGNPDLPNGLRLNPFRRDPLVGASVPRRTPDKVDRGAATSDRTIDSEPLHIGGDGEFTNEPARHSGPSEVSSETQGVILAQARSGGSRGSDTGDGNRKKRSPDPTRGQEDPPEGLERGAKWVDSDRRAHWVGDPKGTYRDNKNLLRDYLGQTATDPFAKNTPDIRAELGPQIPGYKAGVDAQSKIDRLADIRRKVVARRDTVKTSRDNLVKEFQKLADDLDDLGDTLTKKKLAATIEDLRTRFPDRKEDIDDLERHSKKFTQREKDVKRLSERMGNLAGRDYIVSRRGGRMLTGSDVWARGVSDTFDMVGVVDGPPKRLIIVENKGGGSTLGSRVVDGGKVAEQGTTQYRDTVWKIDSELKKALSKDPELSKDLEAGEVEIEYVLVTADKNGKVAVQNFLET
ncbi:hypothetical protein ACFV4K_13775 [Nocardia sp. NPDC059764]|uniref:hypothetical protein n=1 Tax=Nocardia sp. NPDC059764 TaxID=3346939 RepID=UPI003663F0DF